MNKIKFIANPDTNFIFHMFSVAKCGYDNAAATATNILNMISYFFRKMNCFSPFAAVNIVANYTI